MAIKNTESNQSGNEFLLEGNIAFQESEGKPDDLGIKVFAFDRIGEPLGEGELAGKGNFRMALRPGRVGRYSTDGGLSIFYCRLPNVVMAYMLS